MGTGFEAVYADGSEHMVSYSFTSGNTCLAAYDENGILVFNAVVGGDGIWKADIHTAFTAAGTKPDGDGVSWLNLAFRTGEDMDGDFAQASMAMPSMWHDEGTPVSVDVVIEASDHTVAADAALVHAVIDSSLLGDGSKVEISAGGAQHVLEWNGSGFDCATLDFAWQNGEISWIESMPPAGQMLEVQVVQKWLSPTGLEMEAYGEDHAQRLLDLQGKPVEPSGETPTLTDYLDSLAAASLGDIPGMGDPSDIPSSDPMPDSLPADASSIPHSDPMHQDVDPMILAMQSTMG
jgi:hypothetical protein